MFLVVVVVVVVMVVVACMVVVVVALRGYFGCDCGGTKVIPVGSVVGLLDVDDEDPMNFRNTYKPTWRDRQKRRIRRLS